MAHTERPAGVGQPDPSSAAQMSSPSVSPPVDPLPLVGSRVTLRRLSATDLQHFQAYRQDPQVGLYQGWSATDDAQALAFLENMAVAPFFVVGDWFQVGIADTASNALLGDIGIHPFLERVAAESPDGPELEVLVVELGFSLAREAQGRGLAREALQLLMGVLETVPGLWALRGITDARNVPSRRLLERLGFVLQATVETVFRGEPCLELIFERAVNR